MRSRCLTIFEGCDGTGKTTAAKAYAEATGARYVHFPALNRVGPNLARMYVEAMIPALLGYQDVVFDRCWMSEQPYGTVFREGLDRLGLPSIRMLERLAFRCGAIVVKCDPGLQAVVTSYRARKGQEMLQNTAQVEDVYTIYQSSESHLRTVDFNWTQGISIVDVIQNEEAAGFRPMTHLLGMGSAGNWGARFCLVGESFAERKDTDPFYQWPFASFSRHGCSQWLASRLDDNDISERDLFWVNADQDLSLMPQGTKVVALGTFAHRRLLDLGIKHVACEHPQSFKRFRSHDKYKLIDILKGKQ